MQNPKENEPQLYDPQSLDEVVQRITDELKDESYLDAQGNPNPAAESDTDIDEPARLAAVEILTLGGTDPKAIMRLYDEARKKYPDYTVGDSERDITWDIIEHDLQTDDPADPMSHAAAFNVLEHHIADLVADLTSQNAHGLDRADLPGYAGPVAEQQEV